MPDPQVINCQGSQTNGFSQSGRVTSTGTPYGLCHSCMCYVSIEPSVHSLAETPLMVLATHFRTVPQPPIDPRFEVRDDSGWYAVWDTRDHYFVHRMLPQWQAGASAFIYNHLIAGHRILAVDGDGTVVETYTVATPE